MVWDLFDSVVMILVKLVELRGSQNPVEGFMVRWSPALGKVDFFGSLSNSVVRKWVRLFLPSPLADTCSC